MNRDKILFLAIVLLFGLVNAYLLISGRLTTDWNGAGVMVAAGLTLALYSFLYQDNPLFKVAEHAYVGVATAYTFGQIWYSTLYGELLRPLFTDDPEVAETAGILLVVPTVLGGLMLTRFSQRFGWLSRIAFAYYVGLGAGLAIPRIISANLLAQVGPTLQPLSLSWEGLTALLVLVGVVSVLIYFFFSVEHTGVVGVASKVGIWFLMVSFGASFGYTIMARLSLLIGRVQFLLGDWLGLL